MLHLNATVHYSQEMLYVIQVMAALPLVTI